jgi:protease-4
MNQTIRLYKRILSSPWMIDPKEAEGYLPLVMQLITGQKIQMMEDSPETASDHDKYGVYAVSEYENRIYKHMDEAPAGSVAVIPVQDVIDKDDYCGVPGTRSLQSRLEHALSNDNIIGAVLMIDSPGGSPYGTESFANTIATADKPVVSFVEGVAASAAYWIACSADEVMLGGKIAAVGSVGTYATIKDYTKYYEDKGIKIWEVYASKSTKKNLSVRKLIQEADTAPLMSDLDQLNEVFTGHVSAMRADHIDLSQEDVLEGAMYRGQAAIDAGLADGFGSLQDAINRVAELSDERSASQENTNTLNKNSTMFNTKFKALSAAAEKAKAGETISAEEYSSVAAEIQAAGLDAVLVESTDHAAMIQNQTDQAARLSTALQAVRPEATTADEVDVAAEIQAVLAERDQEIQSLNSQLSGSEPPKPLITPKEKLETETKDPLYQTSVDKQLAEMQAQMSLE